MSYEVIVRALADLIVSIDLSDDELVDPEFASAILGDVSAVIDSLGNDERSRIADIITEHAETESNDRRRNALRELPEGLGLTDEDE
jgi:hypothetical protein